MLTILENMRRMNRRYNKKRGSALIMVMMTMAVIFTVGTSMVALTLSSFSTSLAETGREKSYGAALAVSETVKNNLDGILKRYTQRLKAEKGSKVTMEWENALPRNAGGSADYMIIDGAKVSVDLEVTSVVTRTTPDGGSRVVPHEIVVNVRSSCRSQESYISFRAYSESESKQTLLDTYKNSFIMGGDLGGPRRDPNLVFKRIDGDIAIDCRADKMDPENHDIVTRYFNPTAIHGITGSVSANGDIIVGSEDNIVKIRGNLYVDGNLTIRGLDIGCDLAGVWRKDFKKQFARYRTVPNTWIGSFELLGTDSITIDRTPATARVNEAMYGQMVPGGPWLPLQVYYEVPHRYLIDNGITEFWTKKYTKKHSTDTTWQVEKLKVDLQKNGGKPLEDYYGAVMYTDEDCTEMYDMYPKGGNIFCTGDIIVDRDNSGEVGWWKKDGWLSNQDYWFHEVGSSGNWKRVPNQSIVRGNIFCYGRMIVAPANLFATDINNPDVHSDGFVNGRQFVDGYLNTTTERAWRKSGDWRKSVVNIVNSRGWTGENAGYKICTYTRFNMPSQGNRNINRDFTTAAAFRNTFISEYGKKKTDVKNGLIDKLTRTINGSPYEFDALTRNSSGLRGQIDSPGIAYGINGNRYIEAEVNWPYSYTSSNLNAWIGSTSNWLMCANAAELKNGDFVYVPFSDPINPNLTGKCWLQMMSDGDGLGQKINAKMLGWNYDGSNKLRTIKFGDGNSGGNIYIANYDPRYVDGGFQRKNNVGKVGEDGGSYMFKGIKQVRVPGGKVVVNRDTAKTVVFDSISGIEPAGEGIKYLNGSAKEAKGNFNYNYSISNLNSWTGGRSTWGVCTNAASLKNGDYVYVKCKIADNGRPGKCWLRLTADGSGTTINAVMLCWSYDDNPVDGRFHRGFETYCDALTVKLAEIKAKKIYANGPINVIKSDVAGINVPASVTATKDEDNMDALVASGYIKSAFVDGVSFMNDILVRTNANADYGDFFLGQGRTKENAVKSDAYFDIDDHYNTGTPGKPNPHVIVLKLKHRTTSQYAIKAIEAIFVEEYADRYNVGDYDTGYDADEETEHYNEIATILKTRGNKFHLTDRVFIKSLPGTDGYWKGIVYHSPKGGTVSASGFENDAGYNTLSVEITASDIRAIAQNTGLRFIKLISDSNSMHAFIDRSHNYGQMYLVSPSGNSSVTGNAVDYFPDTLAFKGSEYGMYLNRSNKNFEHTVNRKDATGKSSAMVEDVFREMLGEDFAYIPRYVVEHLDAKALEDKIAAATNDHKDDSDYAKYRSNRGGTITRYNDFNIVSGRTFDRDWIVKEAKYGDWYYKSTVEKDHPDKMDKSLNPVGYLLKEINTWADLRYNCNTERFKRLVDGGGGFLAGKNSDYGFFDSPTHYYCGTTADMTINAEKKHEYVNCYMKNRDIYSKPWVDAWWLLCQNSKTDETVRAMKFFNTADGNGTNFLTCVNRFEIDPYDSTDWMVAGRSPRTQIEYIIKDNVYFDFGGGGSGNGPGYKTQNGKGVVFGANFEDAGDLLGATRMKITLDTRDNDIYVYINAPDAKNDNKGSRAGIVLKKVTWQINGDHNAYIILVGDTKMDAKTYSLELVNSLDDPGNVSDEAVGTHFISDEYPVFDYGFNFSDYNSLNLTAKFQVTATPRIDPATGKQQFNPCGTLYIVGSGKNELRMGRGGFVNGVVMIPNGTYINESTGRLLPAIATSASSTATIIADKIRITGSNVGQLTFENYAAGRAEDDLNDNNNGVVKIVETSEEKWSFGGYC